MLPILIDEPGWYDDKVLSPKEILNWFDLYECGWVHDGNPKSPHAELSGGLCSGGYFNCRELFNKNPRLCAIFAGQIVRKLKEAGIEKPDVVVGSSYSAITVSYEVAKILGISHGFTEKDPINPKEQVWNGSIPEDSKVLQIEELITTLGTTMKVRRAVAAKNYSSVEFLPYVGTIIHRPSILPADYGDMEIIALVETEVWALEQKDCPLCKIGSPRYLPKGNWTKLTGRA